MCRCPAAAACEEKACDWIVGGEGGEMFWFHSVTVGGSVLCLRNLSYIYLGYFVCLCVIVCVCHNCGTHCYSFSFGNQTDKGDETEGLEREG